MSNMLPSHIIRQQFIDFFVQRHGHTAVPSAPLIPQGDPTLLFTNAGMNQFKPVFLGLEQPRRPRVCNSQKCIRAGGKHNDLEEVGKDGYHHTFFEMLGNWSFADYYKREAITWAWELFTQVWGISKDVLYATVHTSDTEARDLWLSETDIDPAHVEFHGDKYNFWEMADTGPCGPCSELHIDRGPAHCNMQHVPGHVCRVNGDCARYIELWNLVFIQYNRQECGALEPLEHRYVDTGAGFERLVQVLQGVDSNYSTDLFMPIIEAIAEMSGREYDFGPAGTSHRVVADHIRALTFALADGGLPSNEGRGYVLRRILRRAARHGRLLGLREPFLWKLVDSVVGLMGGHYAELHARRDHVIAVIRAEEERFNQTLDNGLARFEQIVQGLAGDTIPGADAFMLYDTFGFPLDLTRVMAEEKNLRVDEAGFAAEMEAQRARAREAGRFRYDAADYDWRELHPDRPTQFVGYSLHQVVTEVLKWAPRGEGRVTLVLGQTPFYAESGGQLADVGHISNDAFEVRVTAVRKAGDLWLHDGELLRGTPDGAPVTAAIDAEQRLSTARNHTATHLLHAALREVLGAHVQQKGSLVSADRLRFDFTHYHQLTPRELEMVERIVNARVRDCLPVSTTVQSLDEARASGAMALFDEKYDEQVRVVSVEGFSRELCGGTHLNNSGQIGLFVIMSESASAAGIRRIEAITGEHAETWAREQAATLHEVAQTLHVPATETVEKAQALQEELRAALRERDELKLKLAGGRMEELVKNAQTVAGIKLVAARVQADDADALRRLGDELRNRLGSGIGVLAADVDGKAGLLALVSPDLTKRCPAGKLVGEIAALVDGRGGGRPDLAMAGGKDAGKIDEALAQAPAIVARLLEG